MNEINDKLVYKAALPFFVLWQLIKKSARFARTFSSRA